MMSMMPMPMMMMMMITNAANTLDIDIICAQIECKTPCVGHGSKQL